jgi:hypothetical protein
VNTLLRITGIGKLISFYSFIYFNGPGFVKFSGIGLILVIGLSHMYLFPEHFEAERYIGMSFAALFAGTLLSALWMLKGLRWGVDLGVHYLWRGDRRLRRKPHVGLTGPPRSHREGGRARGHLCGGFGVVLHLPLLLDSHGNERRRPRQAGLA